MKKFILSIYFAALIAMFPALFIGYLYSNDTTNTNQPTNTQAKASVSGNDEIIVKPGLIFVIKGI